MDMLYGAISPEILITVKDFYKRIILFDPSGIYSRHVVKPTIRYQTVFMDAAFPTTEQGICACGCGKTVTGRRVRWATDDCSKFAFYVTAIISGRVPIIKKVLNEFTDYNCAICKKEQYSYETKGGYIVDGIHLDHIVSIKNGGGGCWLGNYRFLCHTCNIQKEQTDRLKRHVQTAIPQSTMWA